MSAKKTGQTPSRAIARQRLERVLLKDHANLTPQAVALLSADLRAVLLSYADLESDDIAVRIVRAEPPAVDGATLTLTARIARFKNAGK